MGFDVYGLNAKSEKGKYFRNNVWHWRPLAKYVLDNCNLFDGSKWSTNSGHKVSEKDALLIADTLDMLIKTGRTKEYEKQYTKELENLPLVKCELCKGTGKRDDEYVKGKCNGCHGKGKRKDYATYYPFYVENVKAFAKFCRESGGFEIC